MVESKLKLGVRELVECFSVIEGKPLKCRHPVNHDSFHCPTVWCPD